MNMGPNSELYLKETMMNILLDTHILLWWLDDESRLKPTMRDAIKNQNNQVLVSSVSFWEIMLKKELGKLTCTDQLEDYIVKSGFAWLPLLPKHVQTVISLPRHHKDPFDRMLVAQAVTEDITLMTVDVKMVKYPVRVFL